jgi:hypothetical protein
METCNPQESQNIRPDALYKVGQIVVTSVNGHLKKRHIYREPYWSKSVDSNGAELEDEKKTCSVKDKGIWVYPVDYGLGLGSEGYLSEFNIIRIADDHTDQLLVL